MLIDFRQLFPKYNIKPTGVLHVGANVGEEAPVYDELGIKDVIWIEANPKLIPKLNDTCRKYKHNYHNICVSDTTGETTLHISNNGSQSSSILELGTHKTVHPDVHYIEDIQVSAWRLDEFFTGATNERKLPVHYDLLNMDIQGAELKALHGMGDLLHQFKWAYLEVNWKELYKGCALFPEIKSYMNSFGFKVAEYKECGSTSWGDCLFIRNFKL